ncbi:hypothetical protein K0M31_004755 [Melipona bicolor]|uniref:Uncharacterized protein n=1 Tax=Melipona bicolor TaxID=60889 RepID=A0AA40KMW2_9HYME|nr:hypothetical protein K0M31_004755 [Melipona bicolor]
MKHLFYPEPVSGAAPKVPPTAKITVFSLPARKATAMLCQAQAHPLPIFRYASGERAREEASRLFLGSVQPVGSSPPRLPPRSKFDGLANVQGQGLTLLCEAQASPSPLYR